MKVAIDGRAGMVIRELLSASPLSANYANETLLSVSSFLAKGLFKSLYNVSLLVNWLEHVLNKPIV